MGCSDVAARAGCAKGHATRSQLRANSLLFACRATLAVFALPRPQLRILRGWVAANSSPLTLQSTDHAPSGRLGTTVHSNGGPQVAVCAHVTTSQHAHFSAGSSLATLYVAGGASSNSALVAADVAIGDTPWRTPSDWNSVPTWNQLAEQTEGRSTERLWKARNPLPLKPARATTFSQREQENLMPGSCAPNDSAFNCGLGVQGGRATSTSNRNGETICCNVAVRPRRFRAPGQGSVTPRIGLYPASAYEMRP